MLPALIRFDPVLVIVVRVAPGSQEYASPGVDDEDVRRLTFKESQRSVPRR